MTFKSNWPNVTLRFHDRFMPRYTDLDYFEIDPYTYPRRMMVELLDRRQNDTVIDCESFQAGSLEDFHKQCDEFLAEIKSILQ